jgi:hypothetical protein
MIPSIRQRYNLSFTEEKYKNFLADMNQAYQRTIPFRVAETPVFIAKEFAAKITAASESIIDFIVRDDFKEITRRAIPPDCFVPGETDHTLFLALDFAIVKSQSGELNPQLIEMQGFPSLFGFQDFVAAKFSEHFDIPGGLTSHFELTSGIYREKLKKVLLHGHHPENVILLEIDPLQQNTAIDFMITQDITGIQPVHIGDIEREGRNLYYLKDGKRTAIKRIYNRVIFDELLARKDLKLSFNLTEDVDVEWAGHPNWFFRISKYTMPFIKSPYVPECRFLNDFNAFPEDLENYVLKPLFSFSGTGVVFHVKKDDLDRIPVSEYPNFMLQRKVAYEPVIRSPDGMVKTEIRILFIWEEGQPRPRAVTNLARLSRGEMIGVKFNKDKNWVGGSVCFFEK